MTQYFNTLIITKLVYRFSIIPMKIPEGFFFFSVEIGKLGNDGNALERNCQNNFFGGKGMIKEKKYRKV